MNCQLVAGGYAWTVIPADLAEEYDEALEKACTELDISMFTKLILAQAAEAVRELR